MNLSPDAHWQVLKSLVPGASDRQSGDTAALAQSGRVTVKDGASLLADAAEEIGLHLNEKIERRLHAERRVSAGRPIRLMTIDQINTYLEKSRQPQDPQALAGQVRGLIHEASAQRQGLAYGAHHPRKPTERYLLLQRAALTARAEKLSPRVVEQLEDAIAHLEAQAGPRVFADLASIDEGARFGESSEDISRFQDSVHAILSKPSLIQAFQEALTLADQNGRRLDSAVQNLMQALGDCLATQGVVRDRTLLEALVNELFHLKYLKTLFMDAKSVIRDVRRRQPRRQKHPEHDDGSVIR